MVRVSIKVREKSGFRKTRMRVRVRDEVDYFEGMRVDDKGQGQGGECWQTESWVSMAFEESASKWSDAEWVPIFPNVMSYLFHRPTLSDVLSDTADAEGLRRRIAGVGLRRGKR